MLQKILLFGSIFLNNRPLTDFEKDMKTWKNILFSALFIFLCIVGLTTGVFYYLIWFLPDLQQLLEEEIGEIYEGRFWIYAFVILALQGLLFIIGYLSSLDYDRPRRPVVRLYLGAFGIAFPSVALYAGSLGDLLFTVPAWVALSLASLVLPLSIFLVEWILARVFGYLGQIAFSIQLYALSQSFIAIALCFDLHDRAYTRLFALSLFRRDKLDEAEKILYHLFSEREERSLELLEALEKIYTDTNNQERLVEVLEVLHEQEPEEEKWRNRLLDVHEARGDYRRTIEILEEKPDYENFTYVFRLERLYAEIEPEKAKPLCELLADLEGEPYYQSLILYRLLIQKLPEDVQILESMARLCLKSNHQDEACDYMERILRLQPERRDIRDELMSIYRDNHLYSKLRSHLEYMVHSTDVISADLMAEYIDSLIHSDATDTAVSLIHKAKESYALDYRFPRMLAEIYYEKQQYEPALSEMTQSLALAPEDKTGQLTVLKHKIQGALLNIKLDDIRQQIADRPDDVDLKFKYIEKLTANAYVEKAAAELDKLLYAQPELKDRAIAHLTKLCENYDRTFLLLTYLADLYLKDKVYDKVLDIYNIMADQSLHHDQVLIEGCKKILSLKEDYTPALLLLAELEFKRKNYADAEIAFRKCLEYDSPEKDKIYRFLFKIYHEQNRADELIAVGAPAIEADPYDIGQYKILARALIRLGRFREGLEWLIKAKNVDPDDREVFDLIHRADEGAKKERLSELRDLLQKDPDNTYNHFEFAELNLYFNRFNEAILHFQKAAQQPMLKNKSKVKIALCLAKKGMHDMAEETMAEVDLALDKGNELRELVSAVYDLAVEFEKEKFKDIALKYYKEVFRLDAGFRNVVEKIEKLQNVGTWRKNT